MNFTSVIDVHLPDADADRVRRSHARAIRELQTVNAAQSESPLANTLAINLADPDAERVRRNHATCIAELQAHVGSVVHDARFTEPLAVTLADADADRVRRSHAQAIRELQRVAEGA